MKQAVCPTAPVTKSEARENSGIGGKTGQFLRPRMNTLQPAISFWTGRELKMVLYL